MNSMRIAAISSAVVLIAGVLAAFAISNAPKFVKGICDVIFTIPLVLPPTVVGYILLLFLGPRRVIGKWFLNTFSVRLTMQWWSSVFAVAVIAFPLMYRSARGAFESFDENIADSARTLGLSEKFIFFRIRIPYCRHGLLSGFVLSFARGLGEYGATSMIAGYTPGKTSTISTEVYSLWTAGDDAGAIKWIFLNITISLVILILVNFFEKNDPKRRLS